MDVLSDVLQAIRLTGAVYFDVRVRAPWTGPSPRMTLIRERVMPGFDHVIPFHFMLDGRGWARIEGDNMPPTRVASGDCVIFVQGDGGALGSEANAQAAVDLDRYVRPFDRALPFPIREDGDGDGEAARFVCGYFGCDSRPFNPLLDTLPRLLVVRSDSASGRATGDLIRMALDESNQPSPGGETILARLSELLFLQCLRQHIADLPAQSTGWLAGLRDRHIGAALVLMHGQPAKAWTLESLAREIGMSRAGFAERFAAVMGEPAMRYLGNWRLQIALRLLERNDVSIAQAAAEVGYESEAAFNRAFKSKVGLPPGAWRRSREQ